MAQMTAGKDRRSFSQHPGVTMDKFLAALSLDTPDALKRALVLLFGATAGVGLLAINPALVAHGITPVSDSVMTAAVAALAAKVSVYLLQSGAKSAAIAVATAKAAGDAAGAAVPTPPDAGAVVDAMAGKVTP